MERVLVSARVQGQAGAVRAILQGQQTPEPQGSVVCLAPAILA